VNFYKLDSLFAQYFIQVFIQKKVSNKFKNI